MDQGTGKEVLVVHGGPGFPPAKPWSAATLLSDPYRLIFYHQRGCGQSTRPFERAPKRGVNAFSTLHDKLGLPAHIGDIERIRRILGKDKLVLMGHSFGGLIAALYASEFPEHVTALVLVAPAPRFATFYAAATGLSPTEGEAAVAGAGGFMPYAIYLSMGKRHDWRGALQRVTSPTLVIQGDADLQTVAQAEGFRSLLPNARLAVMPGVRHFPFEEQPAEFAHLVRDFLDTTLSTPRVRVLQ